jgi:hypothetical protein
MNSKLPNQITVARGSGCSGSAIQRNGRKATLTRSGPYLARQLSVFGPGRALSRRVNLCCVLPTLDGDAKRIHGGLSWFRQKKALRPAGKGEYCISLHLSACVGVTSRERGNRSQVSKKEYNGVLLEMLISEVWKMSVLFFRHPSFSL